MDKIMQTKLGITVSLLLLTTSAFAYTYLSPAKPRFDATPSLPEVNYYLSQDLPSISAKADFQNGIYAGLSDDDFWLVMVQQVFEHWNSVPGSYLRLVLSKERKNTIDRNDNLNVIGAGSMAATVAAFAQPVYENSFITDCDVTIKHAEQTATNLSFTLLHEMGHCIGLGHNHLSYKGVMSYSNTDNSKLFLSLDDMAGVQSLYPDPSVNSSTKEYIGCGIVATAPSKSLSLWSFGCLGIPLFASAWSQWRRSFRRRQVSNI